MEEYLQNYTFHFSAAKRSNDSSSKCRVSWRSCVVVISDVVRSMDGCVEGLVGAAIERRVLLLLLLLLLHSPSHWLWSAVVVTPLRWSFLCRPITELTSESAPSDSRLVLRARPFL